MIAVLVHPVVSTALAVVALAGLWWHWWAMGRPGVAPSRRRTRRPTTMLLLVALPLIVAGLSFIDLATQPRAFILTWTLVMVFMLLAMLGAAIDAVNSLRIHQAELDREVAKAAKELRDAARARQESAGQRGDSP
jgi:hypothetical protein